MKRHKTLILIMRSLKLLLTAWLACAFSIEFATRAIEDAKSLTESVQGEEQLSLLEPRGARKLVRRTEKRSQRDSCEKSKLRFAKVTWRQQTAPPKYLFHNGCDCPLLI